MEEPDQIRGYTPISITKKEPNLAFKRLYRIFSEGMRSKMREWVVWFLQNTCCPVVRHEPFNVMFIDLRNENREAWITMQRQTLENVIEIISSREMPADIKDSILKTRTLIFARGLFGYSQMSNNVALLLDIPVIDDPVENARRLLYYLVYMRRQKDAFNRECKSAGESSELAAQYGRAVLSEIAPVVRKVCNRLADLSITHIFRNLKADGDICQT